MAIVGGGLAGLAAAEAALRAGFAVELFDARSRLGGRASSLYEPRAEQWIDHCQHLALGCCTALFDFCARLDAADAFQRHTTFHFLAPDGRRCDLRATRWLPAPLHLLPGFLGLRCLRVRERFRALVALVQLVRSREPHEPPTIGAWLAQRGQSPTAMSRFWTPILTSALGDVPERLAVEAARRVFRDGFLSRDRRAHEIYLPTTPLAELFDQRLAESLKQRGAVLHRSTSIQAIEADGRRASGVRLRDGRLAQADAVVAAVGSRQLGRLLSADARAALPGLETAETLPVAPITAVHLWFDRPVTDLPHAALLERTSQWLFAQAQPSPIGRHVQVVISASHELLGGNDCALVVEVLRELQEALPEAAAARLVHQRVIHAPEAVFTLHPGVDARRPPQRTPIAGLALAGDWTSTGWPATMEGAVRSGRMAVAAIEAEERKWPASAEK